jgi:hypothetical protein
VVDDGIVPLVICKVVAVAFSAPLRDLLLPFPPPLTSIIVDKHASDQAGRCVGICGATAAGWMSMFNDEFGGCCCTGMGTCI